MASVDDPAPSTSGSSDIPKFPIAMKIKIVMLMNDGATNKQIAKTLNIPLNYVHVILGNQIEVGRIQNLLHARRAKAKSSTKYPDVDKALVDWFCHMSKRGTTVTVADAKIKAREFASLLGYLNFYAPNIWLKSWRRQFSVLVESSPKPATVDRKRLPDMGNLGDYSPEDVYMVTEISMYAELLPDSEDVDNVKKLTVLLCCNLSGADKRPLLVVTDPNLSCDASELPCERFPDPNSWITTDVFVNWVMNLDDEMIKQNRKVVLILENSPVHPTEVESDLANIKTVFTDSGSKNPGTGISRNFKACYRREIYERHRLESAITDVDIFNMLNTAWCKVKTDTITSCFWKSGFKLGEEPYFDPPEVKVEMMSTAEFDDYVDLDVDLQCCGVPSDEEFCEKAVFENGSEKISERPPPQQAPADKLTKTQRDALDSLAVLRRYYETNDLTDFSSYYALETQVMDQICKQLSDDTL